MAADVLGRLLAGEPVRTLAERTAALNAAVLLYNLVADYDQQQAEREEAAHLQAERVREDERLAAHEEAVTRFLDDDADRIAAYQRGYEDRTASRPPRSRRGMTAVEQDGYNAGWAAAGPVTEQDLARLRHPSRGRGPGPNSYYQ